MIRALTVASWLTAGIAVACAGVAVHAAATALNNHRPETTR